MDIPPIGLDLPRMSPSHFGRQLLGLALTAPDVLQQPPSEGSRLHGILDEDWPTA